MFTAARNETMWDDQDAHKPKVNFKRLTTAEVDEPDSNDSRMSCVIPQFTCLKPLHFTRSNTFMPATRASKRSAAKTRRGLDASPSIRTRSQTHRDRLCELLLKLDPAAITRAVKVLEANGPERLYLLLQTQGGRLALKRSGTRPVAQGTSRCPPVVSVSSGGDNSNSVSSTFKMTTAFGSSPTNYLPAVFNPIRPFGWTTRNNNQPASTTSSSVGLFTSAHEMKRFGQNVLIVKGDIGVITEIDGHKIDGIAFPTTWSLSNSDTVAAAAVFRRAGDRLTPRTQGMCPISVAGTVRVTPGFGAGVNKLIHAIAPCIATPFHYSHLEITYRQVMEAAQHENLQCLALASIMTGDGSVPCNEDARMALCTIQQFLAREKWPGAVGIVCSGQKEFDAFTEEKQAILDAFVSRSL